MFAGKAVNFAKLEHRKAAMEFRCPGGHVIPHGLVNLKLDSAQCRPCKGVFRVSQTEILEAAPPLENDQPAHGVSVRNNCDGFTIRARPTTWDLWMFWGVAYLSFEATHRTWQLLSDAPRSHWPQVVVLIATATAVIFSLLQAISRTIKHLFVHVVVEVDRREIRVSAGRWRWRTSQRMSRATLCEVLLRQRRQGTTSTERVIVLRGDREVVFGATLSEESRCYVAAILEQRLVSKPMPPVLASA